MKKFVSGLIVGVLLFAGASVFADSSSLIGQKVQGLFSVEKAGTKVADAVIINGTAYAPVRAVSEAAGVDLKVEGKKIIMSESAENTTTPAPTPTPSATAVTNRPTVSAEQAKENKIRSLEGKLATLAGSIAMAEAQLKDKPDNVEFQQKVSDLKAQYADLQAQLAALQAQ
ncbi:hypothetical protein A3842_11240 [Paenibacillus sp. P3E]|uniref:hypothetical protein n=1 Tax=Paenibacillus sp. P3E TaxID=1349435 RepID=UPI00093D4209|nr:hypothetical protein [Paenibacillus sp. P3E]OKP81645.1 hypothetical protein A3842_11240 [Paenibacillus sp. P3E]